MSAAKGKPAPALFWFGLAGLIGALVTGLGEGLIQLVPQADFTDPGYAYFAQISPRRLALGHALAVAAGPLYLCGYWHLTGRLLPGRGGFRLAVFLAMSWAFILAIIWIGQRALLALTVQSVAAGETSADLLSAQAALHEPLVNALRVAILGFSVLWIARIAMGRADYPRWMALFSPGLLLITIFLIYFARPDIGWMVLPTAMNTAHAIVFALSLLTQDRRHAA